MQGEAAAAEADRQQHREVALADVPRGRDVRHGGLGLGGCGWSGRVGRKGLHRGGEDLWRGGGGGVHTKRTSKDRNTKTKTRCVIQCQTVRKQHKDIFVKIETGKERKPKRVSFEKRKTQKNGFGGVPPPFILAGRMTWE